MDLTTVDVRDRWELRPSLEFFDAAARASLDRLVRLACDLLESPAGLLTAVHRGRHSVLAASGLPDGPASAGQPSVNYSICQYPVTSGRPLVVGDTRAHPVLASTRAVREMGVRAYAGIPLRDLDGRPFATMCVIDFTVRDWDDHQLAILARLADIANEICLPEQPGAPTNGGAACGVDATIGIPASEPRRG